MNTTHAPVDKVASVKTLAAGMVLAGVLASAIIGLAASPANAAPAPPNVPGQPGPVAPAPIKAAPPSVANGWVHDPIPLTPAISAPDRVVQGMTFTATLSNWPSGAVQLFVDSPSGIPIPPAQMATPPRGASYTESLTWPINSPAGGYHQLYAEESVGSQTLSAQARVWVDYAPQ